MLLTDDAAWFTDSAQAQLYRVSLADWSVTTLPLSGEWVQNPGNNANGISSTPDGSALVVINSSNGTLYRVDPGSGEATAVDADVPLTAGDGLLRQGRTLYVVQNRLNTIAVLRLSSDGTECRAHRQHHRRALRRADHGGPLGQPALPAQRPVHDTAHAGNAVHRQPGQRPLSRPTARRRRVGPP